MKQQIVTERVPTKVISIDSYNFTYDDDNYPWFGVKHPTEGKGFITRRTYDSGKFTILTPDNLTNGNGWACHDSLILKNVLMTALAGNFEVYRFDTAQELFAWLAE